MHPRTLLGLALLSMLPLSACSDGDGSEQVRPSAPVVQAAPLEVNVTVAEVVGSLAEGDRVQVEQDVRGLVEGYLEGAYGGALPRTDTTAAFADFTPGAALRAAQDADLLTASGLPGADSVGVDAVARVSVLAPRGRAVGATVDLRAILDIREDGEGSEGRLRGRLLLTPTPEGWRVFGYDVARGDGEAR